ncbi:MAG TPA: methyltransferase [Dehalococcoidia bacterium]|nr:methyltransferase [Dehalococcoidia bacterium]
MPNYEMPTTDDRSIWDVWLSMNYLPAVTAADEMQIFASLDHAPATPRELANRLDYDYRTTIAVMRLLGSLGFLAVREGVYRLTDQARLYLLRDSPFYWGHMLGNRTPLHDRLRDQLMGRSPAGRPGAGEQASTGDGRSSGAWASGQIDMEGARRVARSMQSHSLAAAIGFARNSGLEDVQRFLDVGGGSGCFAIALAQQLPSIQATIMELPAMCEVAQEYIRDGGVAGRVDTVAVDMFREPWPAGYDAIFFSNVFHDWNFETCAWLARQSFEVMPVGGRICLHEMLLDDDGAGPATAASFSMLMLGTQGQQFTFAELRQLLEDAGFVDVAAKHTSVYYSLVTGRKT